jgi:ribosomal protein S18 acetylase RimI-like enzyme
LGRSDFLIRKAKPSDVAALARLETEVFDTDRLSRRRLRALSSSDTAELLVACDGDAAIGYALILLRRGSLAARLYSLAVAPGSAGRGIGTRLLDAAEHAALSRGAGEIRLEVRADNRPALDLYERRGYGLLGRREGYYQDGADALRLSRRLAVPLVRAA